MDSRNLTAFIAEHCAEHYGEHCAKFYAYIFYAICHIVYVLRFFVLLLGKMKII